MRLRLVLVLGAALVCVDARATAAQESRAITVRVTMGAGQPVSHALVALGAGVERVTDDGGLVQFLAAAPDSLRINARRMGFAPFSGWVRRQEDAARYDVTLATVVRMLDTIAVIATRNTPLERTGFYERLQRAQRGALAARFITPEELDARNPNMISQMFYGESMVHPQPAGNGRAILRGRNPKCAMTVIVDGMLLRGTPEWAINTRMSVAGGTMYVDDLVPAGQVAAVEIYGSGALAPVELQPIALGNG